MAPFLNQLLRKRRAATGHTQQQVADALSITRQCYASYEEARAEPPLRVLLLLAAMYGCTLDALVGYDPTQPPRPLVKTKRARKVKTPRRAAAPIPAVPSPVPPSRPFVAWH